jgi:predicted GIY-YIG superfamily endonuclease
MFENKANWAISSETLIGDILIKERSTTISKESTLDTQGEKVALFFFYVLKEDDEVKYVGRTVNPKNRYRNHIYEAKKNNRNLRERWIVSLLRRNKKPIMEVVFKKETTLCDAISIEKMLVKKIGKKFKLKNSPDAYLGNVLTGKPVHKYTLDGHFVESYHNSNQAMLNTGIKDSNILRCCKNENGYGSKTAGGYFWSFTKYKKYPHIYISNWRELKGKPVSQLSISDGVVINHYDTAREAERSTGISYKKISAVCNGRQKTAGGYFWKFK